MITVKNPFLRYVIKFAGTFCVLYFGTKAIIGITVPGGYHSNFIDRYLDYPALLRSSLLHGTGLLVQLFGFDTFIRDAYHIAFVNGRGVQIVYSCLGYGLFSFWIAFIFANKGTAIKKMKWILAGCGIIWLINVIRISLVLVATNQQWHTVFTMEQHTLYNIIVYACIFIMIWLFQRSEKRSMDGHKRSLMPGVKRW